MSAIDCETIRDLLPLLHAGGVDAPDRASLEAHVARCDECRAEAELLAMLRRHPATVPEGLAARILRAPIRPGRARRPAAPYYALAAALAGALLVAGLLRGPGDDPAPAAPTGDAELPAGLLQSFWPGDDAMVAGIAPPLHDLSVDELELLLAELDS